MFVLLTCKFANMNFENDLISFEDMLHQHGYRVESRTARSYFEQADGNVQLAFSRFVASLSPAPQPVPEWVQLVDPTGRTYYQNNHTQQVHNPRRLTEIRQHFFPRIPPPSPSSADSMGSTSGLG